MGNYVNYCNVIILVYFDKLLPDCSTVQARTSVLFAHVDILDDQTVYYCPLPKAKPNLRIVIRNLAIQ